MGRPGNGVTATITYKVLDNGCWEWQGVCDKGYGKVIRSVGGKIKRWMAHRWIFIQSGRELKPEDTLHHKCKNRKCVNPDHLEVMSNVDHATMEAALRRAKLTHCPVGHSFAEFERWFISSKGHRSRMCGECGRRKARIVYFVRRFKEEVMRGDEVCALKNILQAIIGWTELNRPDRVLQAIRDADNILGKEPLVPWDLKRQVFPLADNHVLTLESGTPREPIKMALESPDGVEVLVMDCEVARNVANLLLSYCDSMGLRPKRD